LIGQTIAHYRITAKLGAGGMGEVYRATDTKLDREVALKILPDAFAFDPDRMARFEREAKVLASLNHPNIAAIYGVEDRALVMELVEGVEPKGPLPFDDAWKMASQIADALEYAHERGVIHRDLKPANVKVTPDGVVKLLDFGLAKAFSDTPDSAASDPTNSPTVTLGATVAGTIMGTAAYMAPEQAKGKRVDKRADIWSWGVLLYELLTGERLFQGEDTADTLARVLTKDPDLERVPVKARRLLQSCLQKDPKQRLRDIGDAWRQLEETPQAKAGTTKLSWAIAAVLAAAAATLAYVYFREAPPQRAVLRYTLPLPEHALPPQGIAISPDGRMLAMSVRVNGKLQLWLRALDSTESQPLGDTEGATYPFWSPDSRYIGFFAQGKLKKVATSGGLVQALCDAPSGYGGSWSRDDVIVFYPRSAAGFAIQRVSAAGGAPVDVIRNNGASYSPVFLPDGRHFLYSLVGSGKEDGIYLASLDGQENRRILADASWATVATGHLLFVRDGTLMAQPFDASRGNTEGDAAPLAKGATMTTASATGLLIYQKGFTLFSHQLAWYDRSGKMLGALGPPGGTLDPAISPDGRSVAFDRPSAPGAASGWDVWLTDLSRGTERRLTSDVSLNSSPFWSPTGDHIVFNSDRAGGVFNLYQRRIDAASDELLFKNGNWKGPNQWSRDGRFIVFSENDPNTKWDIWVLRVEGAADRTPVPFLRTQFNEFSGQISPDGHWMAYTSDESGQREIYVRPFPSGEGELRISISGGEQPRWRADGKELFFWQTDGKLMAVTVKTRPAGPEAKSSLDPGVPQPLFEAEMSKAPMDPMVQYDVTADGKRFLVDLAGAGEAQPLNVIVNWDAGLKK
jgi:eukaryotic-like serine/threonine-protein kinase